MFSLNWISARRIAGVGSFVAFSFAVAGPAQDIPFGVTPADEATTEAQAAEEAPTAGEAGAVDQTGGAGDLLQGDPTQPEEAPPPQVVDDMQQALLAAIAGYPDPILEAIFTVAQDTGALVEDDVEGASQQFQQAYEVLRPYPRILNTLRNYPYATDAVGELARENLRQTWRIVDEERRQLTQFYVAVGPEAAQAPAAPRMADEQQAPVAPQIAERQQAQPGEAVLPQSVAPAVRQPQVQEPTMEPLIEPLGEDYEPMEGAVEPEGEMDPGEEIVPGDEFERPEVDQLPPGEVPPVREGPPIPGTDETLVDTPGDLPLDPDQILLDPEDLEIVEDEAEYRRSAVMEASETDITPQGDFEVWEDTGRVSRESQIMEQSGRSIPDSAVDAVQEQIARRDAGIPRPEWERVEEPEVRAVVSPDTGTPAPVAESPLLGEPEVDPYAPAGRVGVGGTAEVAIGDIGMRASTIPRTDISGGGSRFGRPQYTNQADWFATILRASLRDPDSIQNVIRSTSARHEREFAETNEYFGDRVGTTSGSRHVRGSGTYGDSGIPAAN